MRGLIGEGKKAPKNPKTAASVPAPSTASSPAPSPVLGSSDEPSPEEETAARSGQGDTAEGRAGGVGHVGAVGSGGAVSGVGGVGGRIREWFRALLRAGIALVITLAVLAVAGGITDIELHVTRHTSTNSTSYAGIQGVVVVLDGDISLHVVGRAQPGTAATLSAVDTSTPFDDPVRTDDVVGGTLYLTERCPDSRCSVDLTLDVNTNDTVNVVAGNGSRLAESVIELDGIVGAAHVIADPAKVVVVHTMATGAVLGQLQCDTPVDCRGIATAPGMSR